MTAMMLSSSCASTKDIENCAIKKVLKVVAGNSDLYYMHVNPHCSLQVISLCKSKTFIFSNSDLCTTNFRLEKGIDLYFKR